MRWSVKRRIMACYFLGLITGCIMANVCGPEKCMEWGIYNENYILSLGKLDIEYQKFFIYLLKNRLLEFGILTLIVFVPIGKWLFEGYIGVLGFAMSLIISVMVMCNGVYGVVMYVITLFPQYIFYVWAMAFLSRVLEVYRNNRTKYVVMQLTMVAVLVLAGVFAETYVNTVLLRKILL